MAQGPRPINQQTAIGTTSWPYWQDQGQQWQFPRVAPASRDEYANRVEVERHEHDATLTFYRDGEKAGKRVAVLTVPLALLDSLTKEKD